MKEIDEFSLPGGRLYHVMHAKDNLASKPMYSIWKGGCRIGSYKDLKTARGAIFDNACLDLARSIKDAKAALAIMEKTRAALANDPFNLGQFKTKAKRTRAADSLGRKDG